MRLWADVYDPTGATKIGAGPIALTSASVKRALDGPGSVSVGLPGWDERALALLQVKRVLRVYVDDADGKREIGAFQIDDVAIGDGGQKSLSVKGKDLLASLRNTITGLGRSYTNQPVATIATSLAALAGWTVNYEAALASENTSMRFDGTSILKALQTLVDERGVHLRLDTVTLNQIELGYFGADSGYRAESIRTAHVDMHINDAVLLIENVQQTASGGEIVNAVMPLGAGDGDAALTLEKSTRSGIVTHTGGDGRTEYWLEDAASIAQYGRIERRLDIKKISPVTNSSSDVINAANALFDAATVWLGRHAAPQFQYSLTCRKVAGTLRPGDKLTLKYRGQVTNPEGVVVDHQKIEGVFWITGVTERWGVEGGVLDVDISSVDAYNAGESGILVGTVDAVTVQGIAVKPFPFVNSYVYRREMASGGFTAEIPIDISNAVMDVTRVRLRLTTRPFRSNVTGSASGGGSATTSAGGGDHNHRVLALTSVSGFPSTSLRPYLGRVSNGGGFLYIRLDSNTNADLWTESSSGSHSHTINIPAHTHAPQYGIYDDSAYPDTVRIAINGTDYTAALGGAWAVGGGALNVVLEISDLLKLSTLQQLHQVRLSCDAGRGEVEAVVEVYGIMQTISVS